MKLREVTGLLLCFLILFLVSCRQPGQKTGKKDLIPSDDLTSLLTDLYIGDGLLAYPPVRSIYSQKDTITSYIDIIKKHGYTKEQMDLTLRYYFVNNPRKLQKIYDEVLARLSEVQLRLQKKGPGQVKNNNLWDQKPSFSLPAEGANNPVYFNIPISDTGIFSLTLSAILYKDDQSLNPRITVFFWRTDSTGKEARKPWEKTELAKDQMKHTYTVVGKLSDPAFTHIGGFLLDCDPQKGRWQKHATISDIQLTKGLPL